MDDVTRTVNHCFPPELRTASVVPRWSIVWTLTRNSVSDHSFYVALYAREIAKTIGWPGDMGDLMYYALVHDLDETITGDIVASVKEHIIDRARADAFIKSQMEHRLPGVVKDVEEIARRGDDIWHEIKKIVKAADRLDALIYLIIEKRLGNGVIASRIEPAQKRFKESWDLLPAPTCKLDSLWYDEMLPAINAHQWYGGNGIWKGEGL